VHASEGTFALHGISVMYARWHQKSGDPKETEIGLSKNIQADLDFMTAELGKSSGKFLFGDQLSVADIQMHFSVAFILQRELGTLGKRWERLEKYVRDCEATESYKKAVEKTGHSF
jgi:glutathione S-transferase